MPAVAGRLQGVNRALLPSNRFESLIMHAQKYTWMSPPVEQYDTDAGWILRMKRIKSVLLKRLGHSSNKMFDNSTVHPLQTFVANIPVLS